MKKYLPLAWRLGLIVAVVVAMLSVVNHFTAPAIAEAEQAAGNAARAELIKDAEFEPLAADAIPAEYASSVTAVYQATANGTFAGYCMDVVTNGYGGEIKLVVAMNAELSVVGVKVISHGETSGIGSKAVDEAGALIPQFIGKTDRNLSEVQTISGASISSKAVVSGVRSAVEAGRLIKEGGNANG